ncbi:MAG: PHP domain-containing protein, partial [Candidatus Limnocylindria bacterium]
MFVHLHTHSCFSFLDGTSTPEELVEAALEQGMDALAVTDTNGLYGAVRFWNAARERGLKPVFGTELRIPDDPAAPKGPATHLVLLAKDRAGWTSLCRIVSAGQLAGKKEEPRFTLEMVEHDREGLIALTGCGQGTVPRAVRAGDLDGARTELARLAQIFGDDLFVELTDHLGPDDPAVCDALAEIAAEQGIGTVVTNDVRYARPEGRRLHDVLRCIDLGLTVDEAGERLAANGER